MSTNLQIVECVISAGMVCMSKNDVDHTNNRASSLGVICTIIMLAASSVKRNVTVWRPSVCFHSMSGTDWPLNFELLFVGVWVMTTARLGFKVKVIMGHGQRSTSTWSVWPRSSLVNHFSSFFLLTLIGRAAHTQRDSPGGSTRRGQRTFSSEYYEDGRTTLLHHHHSK